MTDDIEIELPAGSVPVVTEPGAAPASDSAEAGIEDIRKQLAEKDAIIRATNLALEEANRRASQAHTAAAQNHAVAVDSQSKAAVAEHRVEEANLQSITTTLEAEQSRARALAGAKAKAMADQDFTKAEEIGLEIGEATANIARLKDGKAALDAARTTAPAPAAPVQRQQSDSERREAWLASQNPHNAAWIRQHSDKFFGDAAFQKKATAASSYAIDVLGMAVGTPEYFKHVEEATGLRQKEAPAAARADPVTAASVPTTRTSAAPPVAAAPSREVPSARPGVNGNKISLTPAEVEIARATLTPDIIGKNPDGSAKDPLVVFAQNKAKMQAEGTWDNWRTR